MESYCLSCKKIRQITNGGSRIRLNDLPYLLPGGLSLIRCLACREWATLALEMVSLGLVLLNGQINWARYVQSRKCLKHKINGILLKLGVLSTAKMETWIIYDGVDQKKSLNPRIPKIGRLSFCREDDGLAYARALGRTTIMLCQMDIKAVLAFPVVAVA